MPMLTVKLTDEEMAALRGLAAGRPMSDLVRDWIRGGQAVYTPPDAEGTLGLDTTGGHAVDRVDTSTKVRPTENCRTCDLTYPAGTEHRCTDGWTPETSPWSTREDGAAVFDVERQAKRFEEGLQAPLTPILTGHPDGSVQFHDGRKPGFLAAPDDDCAACGHDRQAYHLDGICRMPTGPRSRCGCPAFVDSSEPF